MLNSIYNIFSSLKLTFVLLCLAALLVFVGTLAQVNIGLYQAQHQFFQSFVVFWGPAGAGWKIPVLPGGYLLGTLLLLNLAIAHFRYYKPGWNNIGIVLIHAGIVLLLVGQFFTDVLQVESHMRLSEGEQKNYSESGRASELAIVDTSEAAQDTVAAISQSRLARGGEIRLPQMPLTLRVLRYYANAEPDFSGPEPGPNGANQGVGKRATFRQLPRVTRMDSRDVPAALVEVMAGPTSLGRWWVSNWLTEERLLSVVWRQAGPPLRQLIEQQQTFTHGGRSYRVAQRPARYYKSFFLELLQFRHDKYEGTDIPKNFSSRVRLENPGTQEKREVLIYMNHPLRYGGETYYQSGYDENDPRVTILQVVRNPGWVTPYLACVLVTVGMLVQFLLHLFRFVKKGGAA